MYMCVCFSKDAYFCRVRVPCVRRGRGPWTGRREERAEGAQRRARAGDKQDSCRDPGFSEILSVVCFAYSNVDF